LYHITIQHRTIVPSHTRTSLELRVSIFFFDLWKTVLMRITRVATMIAEFKAAYNNVLQLGEQHGESVFDGHSGFVETYVFNCWGTSITHADAQALLPSSRHCGHLGLESLSKHCQCHQRAQQRCVPPIHDGMLC
jgi:hypothetical protein